MNSFRSRSLLSVGLQCNRKNPLQAELCLLRALGGFFNIKCKLQKQLAVDFQTVSYQFRAHSVVPVTAKQPYFVNDPSPQDFPHVGVSGVR